MSKGRKKQPVNLILAKGNKSRLTKDEIKARREAEEKIKIDNDKIQAPDYLPKELVEKFDYLAGQLQNIDLMDNLDCDSLARYISSEHNYQRIMKRINRTGIENEKYYQLTLLAEKYFKMARQSASDMGLNITSRLKLTIPESDDKPENKFARFAK